MAKPKANKFHFTISFISFYQAIQFFIYGNFRLQKYTTGNFFELTFEVFIFYNVVMMSQNRLTLYKYAKTNVFNEKHVCKCLSF